VEVRGIAPVRLRSGPMVRTVARPGREMVPVREAQEGGFRCGPGTSRAAGSAPRGGRTVTSCGRRAGIDVGMQP
jgi:hypothetical protein